MSLKDILLTSKKSSDEGISLTEEDTDGEDADTLYKESKHESKGYYKINGPEDPSSPITLNALRPPSHLLKARRASKHNSLPVDKHALQRTHQRQESTNSAVSPRFMAIRKLSEISTLPPNTLSSPMESHKDKEFQNKLVSHIDEIIDTQLQLHLGQLVWRASESHVEARRFWEEQKKEMFGFAAELLDRLDHQQDNTRTKPNCDTEEEKQKWIDMENELLKYKLKNSKKQRELFEMDVLKTRNAELEKEHEKAIVQLNQLEKQRAEKMKLEERVKDLEEQVANYRVLSDYHQVGETNVSDLVALNKQLKNQLSSVEQINRQLHDQMMEYENKLKVQKTSIREISQRNKILEIELVQYKVQLSPSVTATSTVKSTVGITGSSPVATEKKKLQDEQGKEGEGLDCGEDFGTKKNDPVVATVNWAEMMNSEDEVINWSKKYKLLEKEYKHLCQKLKDVEVKDEKKQVDLLQALNSKEDEIKRLKQAGRVNHIQLNYLQQELNKCQPKKKKVIQKTTAPEEEEFATKDGYLTFTTEINGQPSTYSIKIPNNQRLNPNAPPWRQ